LRIEEELNERKIIMSNRIKEQDLLASRMGWDVIDYSDHQLVDYEDLPIYWWKMEKKNKDEESKDLSSVLLFDLSRNKLETWPSNEFFFRADKIQVMTMDYNALKSLPSGLKDCRDLLNVTCKKSSTRSVQTMLITDCCVCFFTPSASVSQNNLNGSTVLGAETPLNFLHHLVALDLSGNCIEEWPSKNGFRGITTLEVLRLGRNNYSICCLVILLFILLFMSTSPE